MSPLAVLTKLAAMLRSVPAVRLVFAKFEALLRNKESGEPLASEFLGEASGVTINTVDQHAAVLQPSSDQSEREKANSPTLDRDRDQNVEPRCSPCRTCCAKYSRSDRVVVAEVRRDPA